MRLPEKSKILGMLWGLHAGDSLGATLEFLPASPVWNTHQDLLGGGEFHWRPGEATDDTDLMLCVLKALRSPREFDFNILKREMLLWYHSQPPDIGNTTRKGLAQLDAGAPLRDCGPVDNDFQGNGSIMRVAPMALLDEDADGVFGESSFFSLLDIMLTQTKMTHGHQHCVDCDVIFVAALKAVLQGHSKPEVFARALAVAEGISPLIAARIVAVPDLEWSQVKSSGFCVDTLCAGLWGFLKYSNFEDSVIAVVNRGDDADSCGAVTGALCGAYYGATAIPARWLDVLELKPAITAEIERLFAQGLA